MAARCVSDRAGSRSRRLCKPASLPARLVAAFCGTIIAVTLGGCAVSMPIGSLFGADDPPTGSVDASAPIGVAGQKVLAESMNAEDARRSQGALSLALDPEGNGAPVNWDNPGSGAKGSFRSQGEFFLAGNELCRRFSATLERDGAADAYAGSACRSGPQSWIITEISKQEAAGAQR